MKTGEILRARWDAGFGWVLVIAVAVLLPTPDTAHAQGRWVEHTTVGLGSGSDISTRDDGCLGYTKTNSQKLLVFDIQVGDWLEIDLGAVQVFEEMETVGNLVFAWTDNLLIGYSAIATAWDTVTYEGDYMGGTIYYYGCGNNLAYFITKSYLYVFDGWLGTWQRYAYGLPGDYTGCDTWVMDDYVGVKLTRTYPAQPKNVVYSGHTHSFNQTDDGTYKPSPLMDHGYAGRFNVGYDGETYELIGYSALTNSFNVVHYVCGDNEALVTGSGAGSWPADKFTTRAYSFRHVVASESVTANFYGYDTRRGSWDHTVVTWDWDLDRYYGGWYQGGQFTFDHSLFEADRSFHFYIYSGLDGVFRDFASGLVYTSTTAGFRGGGTVFGSFDTLTAWGYDVAGNRGAYVGLALDECTNFYRGEDWLTITRWSTTADTMITYFYNGNTNNWSTAVVPEKWNQDGSALPHMYYYTSVSYTHLTLPTN